MPQFEGRVIAVTGGGSGIGAEVVRTLCQDGARVVALDLNESGLARTTDALGENVYGIRCDITDEDAVVHAFDDGVVRYGRLDGLVNAAGIVVSRPFLDFEVDDWDRTFRVNVWGSFATIKHVVPHLRRAGGGSIVNFSSIGGKLSNPYTAPYAASKAAVISLTRSASGSLAPDIRVNCVVPGIIDTPMWEQLDRDFKAAGAEIDFASRSVQAPLGRAGTPDDVAGVVSFLLSDAARFVTGEDLNVSGGLVMY